MNATIKSAIGAWLACYGALVWAANNTFAQDMLDYDWVSLLLAAGAGLVGGAGRTLLTLLTKTSLVGNQKVLLLKDLAVALVGGAAVFLCIEAWNVVSDRMHWIHVDRGLRVVILVYAGYSRGRWLGVLDSFATDLIARARQWIRGKAEDPAVAAAPPDPTGTP